MEINVCLMKRKGRKYYEAQWRDPVTGKKKTESTKKSKKRDAERVAALIEQKLRDGLYKRRTVLLWPEFREKFESQKLPSLADKTACIYITAFNAVERVIDPKLLQSIDNEQVSRFQSQLRKEELSEATIKSYLRHLKAALRWAQNKDLLTKVPSFDMPKRGGGMKGRGITTEEFERMLSFVPKVVASTYRRDRTRLILKAARILDSDGSELTDLLKRLRQTDDQIRSVIESWRYLMTGLWWSGLRLGEALNLHWTDDRLMCVDFKHKHPMFRIQAEGQKSNKYELLPLAPEFAEFLATVPDESRRGFVFDPLPSRPGNGRLRLDTTSSIISVIGKKSKVKVAEKNNKVKYASAHDLRRAFGGRWSLRVMPPVLKQLMRHQSIDTTMEYYVGHNAEQAADVLWNAVVEEPRPAGTIGELRAVK